MKKDYYEKIVTWKQKPDYFGIICCCAFINLGFLMSCLGLYNYKVPVTWWFLQWIFISMFLFGIKKLKGAFPKGREVRYKKIKK